MSPKDTAPGKGPPPPRDRRASHPEPPALRAVPAAAEASAAGNAAMLRREGLSSTLVVEPPGTADERAADAVAAMVADAPGGDASRVLPANGRACGDDGANGIAVGPGRPLAPPTLAFARASLGAGFEDVRVHEGTEAARVAAALGARAFARGTHIWLGAGERETDRHLMAHELAHVAQHRAGRRAAELPVRRTIGGAIAGAIPGAAIGAKLGSRLGVWGAIGGGVAGGVVGAFVGNALSTKSRAMTPAERSYADEVFKGSVNYDLVTITQDSLLAAGAARTIGNTIHLRTVAEHFVPDPANPGAFTMELTEKGLRTLVHELTHVWQYQHGGVGYIGSSLWAQTKAWWQTGERKGAYDWRAAKSAGLPWDQWNAEQQAKAVEVYNAALQRTLTTPPSDTPADRALIAELQPYIDEVRAGRGA